MTTAPTYKFEVFEGPLDLLLSLIEKHKIDIYDIKISLLLEQYMLYIKEAKERNWDLTADFIEMAARRMCIFTWCRADTTFVNFALTGGNYR